MPLMLTQVVEEKLSLTDYVRMTSLAPAKACGLYPRKGALLPGSDADLVVVDLGHAQEIDSAAVQSKGLAPRFTLTRLLAHRSTRSCAAAS